MKTTATQYVDDVTVIVSATQLVERAKREGSAILHVPRWLLEQLIEKAQRPHD